MVDSRIYIDGKDFFYDVFLGKRNIYSPSEKLRYCQKIFLQQMKTIYKLKWNIKSITQVHCNQKWILKADIKNFYESFSKEQIKNTINVFCEKLKSSYKINVCPQDMYNCCTIAGKLPTGALTSAHIANYTFDLLGIDKNIKQFCKEKNVNYSRYMDDLMFSSDSKEKLQEVEIFLKNLLKLHGLFLNKRKLKYISDNKKQEILGVLVNNKKPAISKINKRNIRSIICTYLNSIYLQCYYGRIDYLAQKSGYEMIVGYMSYLKETDFKYYEKMKDFIYDKSFKLEILNNAEVKKIIKIFDIKKDSSQLTFNIF